MNKFIFLLTLITFYSLTSYCQEVYTKFSIPESVEKKAFKIIDNCNSCNEALNPELLRKQTLYRQSNLKDWIYQYFKSTEEQRRDMKNNTSDDIDLSAVVKSIPIKFGYNSSESNEHNYWSKKYTEWVNTRLITIDDIIYIFKQDSEDQLKAWLLCRKESCTSAANYADEKIIIDIAKIREGNFDIALLNLSIATIRISDIQLPDFLIKKSGKDFKVGKKVSNKGGKVIGNFSSSSTLDENFSIKISYKIVGTNDENTITAVIKKVSTLPEVPIGTIISTTMTYEQFLKANQFDNLASADQKWLPCDGRSVINGNYITKTPDLRGLFLRGSNIMDKNENNHTKQVDQRQKNPDEPQWGIIQDEAFLLHNHDNGAYLEKKDGLQLYGQNRESERVFNSYTSHAFPHVTGLTNKVGGNETRPKNLSIIYLIKVR